MGHRGTVASENQQPRQARRLSGALIGALVAAVLVAAPAAAATPTTEVFTLLQGDHTWSATGAFSDAGSWHTYRPLAGGLGSPVAFAGTLFITLTSAEGTINLRLFVEFNQVQERDLCTVTGGTGAYARLAGQGTWTEVGRGTEAVLTCTAAVNAP